MNSELIVLIHGAFDLGQIWFKIIQTQSTLFVPEEQLKAHRAIEQKQSSKNATVLQYIQFNSIQ